MGASMVKRIREAGHEVVVYDPDPQARMRAQELGCVAVDSLDALPAALGEPRSVWNMVPGFATEDTLNHLQEILSPGDTIIDGGNSHFEDSMRRAADARTHGINFIDAGTSGGIWGPLYGYCMMVGGDADAVKRHDPIFTALAPEHGYHYAGPSGAGHYLKMVHNGIEYGMMQSIAEGFNVMGSSDRFPDLDLHAIAGIWNHGSVIRCWLMELAEQILADDPRLANLGGEIDFTGEGAWTVQEAMRLGVPTPAISGALMARYASVGGSEMGNKLTAALRHAFGGHAVHPPAPSKGAPTQDLS